MTAADTRQRPALRTVLAAVAIADLIAFLPFILEARQTALAAGAAIEPFIDVLSRPFAVTVVTIAGVAGAGVFACGPGRVWAGLVSLAALSLLSTVHAQLFGSPWRHLFYSGVCMTGWILGLTVSRSRGTLTDESYARIGATALLGATYLNAGISKLAFGGADWISGVPIQAAIIGQDGLVADGILSAYRTWAVNTPAATISFSALTVGLELAGPLMILGTGVRRAVALGLIAMHLNIYLLTTHILYWESMVFLLFFGLASDETEWTTAGSVSVPGARRRGFAVAVAVLAVWAAIAVAHQAERYARARSAKAGASLAARAPVPPTATMARLQQVGPLSVGQILCDGWSIESLAVRDGGIVIAVVGAPGTARFEVTCAASEQRSPFDVGDGHIFYSNDLAYRDLEAPGRALSEYLRRAAADRDVCAALSSWLTGPS